MQENKAQKVIEEVKKAFIGKTECVEKLMTAILAGGVTSNHVSHSGNGDTSESFWAIDYGMFGDKREMRARCSRLLEELRESEKAAGETRIYTHGEKELESAAEKRVS